MSANAEIIAELRRVLNERDEARERNTDLRKMLERVTRERDSYQRQLDAIGDAIVPALVQRIEPRLSRHPVTVIMAAGSLIAKIGEAIGCEFADGDDLLEAVKELVRERDEAREQLDLTKRELGRWVDRETKAARERDEARAEVRVLQELLMRSQNEREQSLCRQEDLEADVRYYEDRWGRIVGGAYQRGAEAMREACAKWVDHWVSGHVADKLRDLPIPEEP